MGYNYLTMLPFLLALKVPVTAIALLYARWEYRRRGELSLFGLALVCAMLLVPILILHFAIKYQLPDTPLDYAGVLIASTGMALCIAGMTAFHSMRKVLCLDSGRLTATGPYRWSRNPQYLGSVLILLGFALNDWTLWCLASLITIAVSLHLLVLIEEEHLHSSFGEPYADYCRRVPRYVGWK